MVCSFGLLRNCSSIPARILSSALHCLSYFSTKMGRSEMLKFAQCYSWWLLPGCSSCFGPPIVHSASACCKNEEGCCVLNKAPSWLQEWERKECKFSLSSLLHKWTVWRLWLLICSVCSVSANFGAAARNGLNLFFIPKDCGQAIDFF